MELENGRRERGDKRNRIKARREGEKGRRKNKKRGDVIIK